MAQNELINRSLDAGKDVTQRTQERIETLLRDLTKNAEDQANQAQQLFQDLVERSRTTTEQLVEVVDREIRAQIASVGLATKADLSRLEKTISSLFSGAKAAAPVRKAPSSANAAQPAIKTPTKKTPATKSAAKRAKTAVVKEAAAARPSAAKSSVTKKAPAKKAIASKAVATKRTAPKATTKKRPAKKSAGS
jgi:polyhydroxyalkanoate synthesis regulator phasin